MKINNILNKDEKINIKSYLSKFGIIDIDEYLNPTGKYIDFPLNFLNMSEAIELFKYHYLQKNKVFILCDSGDTDGITSTSILYMYMKRLNPKWDIKILIHTGKQRGMQDEELFNNIITQKRSLVIIPDSGSNDYAQAEKLKELNISLLVLDHHICQTPIKYGTLINNQLGNVDKNGSGCVVTYQFLRQLDVEFNHKWANDYLDLTALSIVSDGCSFLSMQNRELMYYGFRNIKNEMLKGLIRDNKITPHFLSFSVIPCINSVCRGKDQQAKQNMIMGFLGLKKVDDIVDVCKSAHTKQKKLVNDVIEDNISNIDKTNKVIFFANTEIPRSYSGLIASKLSNICKNKPTIVGKIIDGYLIGSVRSQVPTLDILSKNELVDFAQGHPCQHGIGIYEKNIQGLINYLNTIDFEDNSAIDVVQSYNIKEVPKELFDCFNGYEHLWGNDLKIPQYYIEPFTIDSDHISIIGKNQNVLKFYKDGIEFIKFFCSQKDKDDLFINDIKNHKLTIDIVGELSYNIFRGKVTKQCIIDKYEVKEKKELTLEDIF